MTYRENGGSVVRHNIIQYEMNDHYLGGGGGGSLDLLGINRGLFGVLAE